MRVSTPLLRLWIESIYYEYNLFKRFDYHQGFLWDKPKPHGCFGFKPSSSGWLTTTNAIKQKNHQKQIIGGKK